MLLLFFSETFVRVLSTDSSSGELLCKEGWQILEKMEWTALSNGRKVVGTSRYAQQC